MRQENTDKPAYSFNLQPTRQFLTRAALNAISQIRNYAVVRSRRKRERGKNGRRVKRERKVGYKREQQNRLITFRRIVNSYDKLLLIKAILACRYEKRHLESKMNVGGKKRTRTTPLQCPHRARSGACHRR